MRKTIACNCLFVLTLLTGCAMSDTVFNLFGDHYTGGGTTRAEKRHHYDQQIEAAQSQSTWQP